MTYILMIKICFHSSRELEHYKYESFQSFHENDHFQIVRPLVTLTPKRPLSQFKVNMITQQSNLLLLSCKTPYSLSLFDLNKSVIGGEVEGAIKGKINSELEDDLM